MTSLAVITDMDSVSFLSPFGVRVDHQCIALHDPACAAWLSESECVVVAEIWIQRQVRAADEPNTWPATGADEQVLSVDGERYVLAASLDPQLDPLISIDFLADLECVVPEADWMMCSRPENLGLWRSEGLNWLAARVDGQVVATECWRGDSQDAARIAAFRFRNQVTESVARLEDIYPKPVPAGQPC